MQIKSRRSNRERTDATRAALIEAARKLFVEKGYAGTGTPDIVAAAAVTRGALYHHFADKKDLFRAVVEAELRAVAGDIEDATLADLPPFDALIEGGTAFFRAMTVPGRTRLILIDAPAVLGWDDLYAIDARHGTRTLREGLDAAMRAGVIRHLPFDALTLLMSALFDRAALAVESGANAGDIEEVIRAIFTGLKTG